jgi:hypothetical protein
LPLSGEINIIRPVFHALCPAARGEFRCPW